MDRYISMMGTIAKEQKDLGEFDEALSTCKGIIKHLIKENPSLENYLILAKTLNDCGLLCEHLDELEDALDYYLESIKVFKKVTKMDNSLILLEALSTAEVNAGIIYRDLDYDDEFVEKFEESNKLLRKIIKINESPSALYALSRNLSALGVFFEDELDFKEAEIYYKELLDVNLKLYELDPNEVTKEDLSFSFNRYAFILGLNGQVDKSIEVYNKAAEMLDET